MEAHDLANRITLRPKNRDAGEMLLREIERSASLDYDVVGLVDDNPHLQRQRIHGVEVIGSIERIPELCRSKAVQEILIAIPSASRELQQRIVKLCRQCSVSAKKVPTLKELIEGRARISQLEDVRPEDLLGRQAVRMDVGRARKELCRKSSSPKASSCSTERKAHSTLLPMSSNLLFPV